MRSSRKQPVASLLIIMVVLIIAMMNGACEYESSAVYFVDIEQVEGEIPYANLSFTDSVIYINQSTLFGYTLNFIEQEVYQVEFYLDDRLLKSMGESSGSVLIEVEPGKHIFEMVIITSTESGSIADKIGAEAFYYTITWTIYSESAEAGEIQIQSIDKAEGSLRIEWE